VHLVATRGEALDRRLEEPQIGVVAREEQDLHRGRELVVCPTRSGTGRSDVAASEIALEGLLRLALNQPEHSTRPS
jgi:hypothetical protein